MPVLVSRNSLPPRFRIDSKSPPYARKSATIWQSPRQTPRHGRCYSELSNDFSACYSLAERHRANSQYKAGSTVTARCRRFHSDGPSDSLPRYRPLSKPMFGPSAPGKPRRGARASAFRKGDLRPAVWLMSKAASQAAFSFGKREKARRDGDARRASSSHRTNGHSTRRGAETVTVLPTVAFG